MNRNKLEDCWSSLSGRVGKQRLVAIFWLVGIGVVSLIVQLLILTDLHRSALLYMMIPYSISVCLVWFRKYQQPKSVTQRYGRHLVSTLIVLFASSIILREGFICVIFILPIYLFFVSISYLAALDHERRSAKTNKKYSTVVPLLVLLLSLEGTTNTLSMPRSTFVELSRDTELSV